MATVKVSELKVGPVLDWAVAKAIGQRVGIFDKLVFRVDPEDEDGQPQEYRPSTDWAQGGPLLDSNPIVYRHYEDGRIEACLMAGSFNTRRRRIAQQMGATILEAACKSIVASVFTTVVEIPDELEN